MTALSQDAIESTAIAGVTLTPLRQLVDERGAVLHMLRNDALNFGGFGECYFSEVNPGIVKAWKLHQQQTQNIAVPIGRIYMALYDDRPTSDTYQAQLQFELGRPDAYQLLQIPPGIIYGFQCISTVPALLVNCASIPHDPLESHLYSLAELEDKIQVSWPGLSTK